MIIYKNNNEYKALLNQEKTMISQLLEYQKNQKNLLMSFIVKFVDYLDNNNLNSIDEIASFVEELKDSIEICNDSINCAELINQALDKASNMKLKHNDASYKKIVTSYNEAYFSNISKINENNTKILDTIYSISQNSSFDMLSESQEFLNNIDKRYKHVYNTPKEEAPTVIDKNFYANIGTDIQLSNIKENVEVEDNEDELEEEEEEEIIEQPNIIPENTLLISESMQKVILPFTYDLAEKYLAEYPSEFIDVEDVIEKLYTIPLRSFRNPAIARFRETFRLMRERENSSIKDAIDLGLEMMFNYNLYPAIITACKNLDELDIYLAYLETGEVDKFRIFDIVYQLSPALSK